MISIYRDTVDNSSLAKKFEFPGSKRQYAESISLDIDYMIIDIKPNFESKTLTNCEEQIDITARKDIDTLEFDIAEINIHKIQLDYLDKDNNETNQATVQPIINKENPDKIGIKLPQYLLERQKIRLKIVYSCGSIENDSPQKPRSGFHFIEDKNGKAYQIWTQGETIESRYWFPCIDHPQLKYQREIRVTAPDNYIVISNGEKINKENNKWIWREKTPNPAYLTSVVIGEFDEEHEKYKVDEEYIDLDYYWPKRILKEDAMRTYGRTSEIMKFFEYYLDIKYPYEKYSQVAVDEYEFGGMENISATTLNENLFHDKTASIDFNDDIITVVHEIAHQWFGDLVTREDWQDIWLNEGFAHYCEALYLDKEYIYHPNSRDQSIRNEFFYKVYSSSQTYFNDATTLYKRPIVTNIYKHPDELLDGHAYAKAGLVLHMLRSMIKKDEKFRKVLNKYLKKHKFKNSETDDLRQIFEEETGLNLLQFFDQWLYRAGHPEIEFEFSLNESNDLTIKTKQIQPEDPFVFSLEVRIVYRSGKEELKVIELSEKEEIFKHLTLDSEEIYWFSIDPELKILKKVGKITIPYETPNFQMRQFLTRKLLNGKTIIEKIDGAHELSKYYSDEVLDVLLTCLKSSFYGVAEAVANTIGSFKDDSDYKKTENAYLKLKAILDDESAFSNLHPKVKRAVVFNIGKFERKESIHRLKQVLKDDKEGYYLRSDAATAIAKSSLKLNSDEKMDTICKLEKLITDSNSFRQVIAQGAISGLREFFNDSDATIIMRIGTFLIERTSNLNNYFIRLAAISALRKFLRTKKHDSNSDIIGLNDKLFNQLVSLLDIELLNNTRRRIKINTASSLVDPDALGTVPDQKTFKTVNVLTSVVKYEVDGFVRKSVERSLYVIRDYLTKWIDNPPTIEFIRKAVKREKEIPYIELTQSEKAGYEKTLESIRSTDLPIY
jgi:aminopeptidase N